MKLPAQAGLLLTDENLDFGEMKMLPGRAFPFGSDAQQTGVMVSKSWLTLSGRWLLVEEIPVEALAAGLAQLPVPQEAATQTSVNSTLHVASVKRQLPAPRPMKASSGGQIRQVAQAASPTPNLVLDYEMVRSQSNYTFKANMTYCVVMSFNLYGTNTFEGGAVIKYYNGASLSILPISISPGINWQASAYRPVIFTSKDDNSVGEIISGSTGTPTNYYANPALAMTGFSSEPTIAYFRVAYAKQAFSLVGSSSSYSHGQIVNCQGGFTAYGVNHVRLRNVLFGSVQTNFNNLFSSTIDAQNSTFNSSSYLLTIQDTPSQGVSALFTNCVFANISKLSNNFSSSPLFFQVAACTNGFYNAPQFGVAPVTNSFYPFAGVGAGNFYLTNGCQFTHAGTPAIDPILLVALRQKTTHAPVIYTPTTISTNLTLSAQVQRDTNISPDLGYHYDPVDYIVDSLTITNAVLTVTNGAVIANYNRCGIQLQDGSSIVSLGSPLVPNRFVRYQSVQEQSSVLGGTNLSSALSVNPVHSGTNGPTAAFQFTQFTCPAGGGGHLYDSGATNYSNLLAQNCEFWGGQNYLAGSTNTTITLKNNLFFRSSINAASTNLASKLYFTNNMVFGGSVTISNASWNAFYNDFDSCTITNSTLVSGYNAYLNCSGRLQPTNVNDVVQAGTLSYKSGSLGNFYQPAGSPLVDKGDVYAGQVGLYHFTTQTNQIKEGSSQVDIGYHYVAVGTNGCPIDTNGDGISDYLEDANGNGSVDNGEYNWHSGIILSGTELNYTVGSAPIPVDRAAAIVTPNFTNLIGGTLTITLTANWQPEDVLAINNQGRGTGQVGITNNIVTYGGIYLGTFSGGSGSNALVITFTNSTATLTAMQAVLTNISYHYYPSTGESLATRTAQFILNDNQGKSNFPVAKYIHVDCPLALNAMLVIDCSGSMFETLGSSKTKLQAATNAAAAFVNSLGFPDDQVGLVIFSNTASLFCPLTNNGYITTIIANLIGNVVTSGTTGTSNGIFLAQSQFPTNTASTNALPVMILLTDGVPNVPDGEAAARVAALTAANQVRQAGIRLVTIGLGVKGTTFDPVLVTNLASAPDDSHCVTNTDDLLPVFAAIANSVCHILVTNEPLTVQIDSPINQTLLARSNVVIIATATNTTPGVTISWVEFFANGTNSLGFVLTPTDGFYQLNWTPSVGGTNILTALAKDSQGSNAWSSPVTNYIRSRPIVTIISPTNGQIFLTSPANIILGATAIADGAMITNVAFYQGTNFIGATTNGPPYQITWPASNGTYTLKAKATDSTGHSGTSLPVIITVVTNQPPSVYAGPDQTINLATNPLQLTGLISDDGLLYGIPSVSWKQISGPTNVTFTITNLPATWAYIYATGVYQLELSVRDGEYTNWSTNTITVLKSNLPPNVNAGSSQTLVLPALGNTNLLQTVNLRILTNVPSDGSVLVAGGIDYFAPSNCAIISMHSNSFLSTAVFYLMAKDGTAKPFISISNACVGYMYKNCYVEGAIATAKNTNGGFKVGEIIFANTYADSHEILRIDPSGTNRWTLGQYGNAWVVLPIETGGVTGLWLDNTTVWGGDLIVCTQQGDVWRINSAGQATLIVAGIPPQWEPEGLTTIPNDIQKYGPWAGRILVGGDSRPISAIDTNGFVVNYNLGPNCYPNNIRVIPANENLVTCADYYQNIYGISASELQGLVGEVLIAGVAMFRAHWNGTNFDLYSFESNIILGDSDWCELSFTPEPLCDMPTNYVQLNGTVQDDGQFNPTINTWTRVSGPGTMTFGDPSQTNTYAVFTEPGTNYLRLSADDGQFVRYDDIQITVIRNQRPVADAGTNQVIATTNATLRWGVSDDGLPIGVTNINWTCISRPNGGVVTNINSSSGVTTACFTQPGTYILRLTADDGQATNWADVTITVKLPCLTLTPAYGWPTLTNAPYTVVARLVDPNNNPIAGGRLLFSVSGANPWVSEWETNTDVNGQASFTYGYINSWIGRDTIKVYAPDLAGTAPAYAVKEWALDLECGDTIFFSGNFGCLSVDWPTNDERYAAYYLFNGTAGENIDLNYTPQPGMYTSAEALVLRDP
jgi:hypothetical protein